MREAINAGVEREDFSSPASYAHFLQARLLHHAGSHRAAADELRLALATDEGNPYLLTQLGEEYARLGDLNKAEAELRRAVEVASRYYPAHVMLGRVLLEAGRYPKARMHLRRAVTLKPREPEAYLVLAQLHLEAKQPEEAVKVVEELAAALPGEASGYRRLGLALAERGDKARAEKLLVQAIERDPADVEVSMTLARLYEASGRSSEAEECLARALEHDPDNRDVLLSAGRIALKLGSATRARAYFDRLLSLSDDPELTVRVAFAFLASRETAAAAEVLDMARRGRPKEPRISYYAGLVHERQRHYAQAAAAYAEVPESSELFDEVRSRRAQCLSRAGQHSQALALFETSLAEAPDDASLRVQYARALERSGAADRAEAVLKEALARTPAPELYEALASTLHRRGRSAEGVALLSEAVSRKPRDEALLYALGAAYDQQGDADKALAQMRAVLAINADNAAAMNFIGYLLAQKRRDLSEAERLVLRALELRPDTGAFLDSLGWVYFQRGEYQRAVEALERATQLEPDEPVILEHLGDAYRQTSRRAEAVTTWRRAIEVLTLDPEAADPPLQRMLLERKLKMLSTEAAGR
ncbi:tetratricopeptide repeat protein [Hyalangium gracile]|uniref:tetratricopeptide repeat protein n=1 Tax=Hyalangium gracile TaxID=394092 RepID=UPI001CCE12AC|nr:tetratricopeptide repeat protein [Hyalangium gracile]